MAQLKTMVGAMVPAAANRQALMAPDGGKASELVATQRVLFDTVVQRNVSLKQETVAEFEAAMDVKM